ncbi:MAG: response regulator [Chloroflexota bacterium]
MISSSDILNGKILIVDDKQVNILLLERMLSAAGYVSISSTLNPLLVSEMHLKYSYDLILLDIQMPGIDGFQVMESLKKIEPEGYLPVIVITAHPNHKLHVLHAGAKDFISKPFELEDVLVRVHNMLEVRLLHKKLRSSNDALKQQVHEQTTLLAISHTLASSLQFQPNLILKQLQEIIPYTQGGIFALESPALFSLALRGTHTLEQSDPVHILLNTPEALESLANANQPIRIADVWSTDPQAQFLRSVLDDDAAELLEGIHSWMWVPLAVQGRFLGGIGLAESTKNFFTAQHAELAQSVANQTAITLSNAKLAGQAQTLAVSEERLCLAHDLHDAVDQSLFSAGLIAEALPRLWDMDLPEGKRSLTELRLLIQGALSEMSTLLAELRPQH